MKTVRQLLMQMCNGPVVIGSIAGVVTTNGYSSALLKEINAFGNFTAVFIKENNVNSIDYQVLGSMDNTNWTTAEDEDDVSLVDIALSNAFAVRFIKHPWKYIDVQIKPTTPDSQGDVDISIIRG